MLPAVPAIIGIVLLGKSSSHVRVVDVICLVIGGVTAFAVGVWPRPSQTPGASPTADSAAPAERVQRAPAQGRLPTEP